METLASPDPDPETITRYVTETFPDVDIVEAMNARFFSRDPEKHWPNFATIVTTDEHDDASDLARPGVYRLNIGALDKETFRRIAQSDADPDYTALDRLFPHPVYARQRWVSILNPSAATFDGLVKPLLAEAYARIAPRRR